MKSIIDGNKYLLHFKLAKLYKKLKRRVRHHVSIISVLSQLLLLQELVLEVQVNFISNLTSQMCEIIVFKSFDYCKISIHHSKTEFLSASKLFWVNRIKQKYNLLVTLINLIAYQNSTFVTFTVYKHNFIVFFHRCYKFCRKGFSLGNMYLHKIFQYQSLHSIKK